MSIRRKLCLGATAALLPTVALANFAWPPLFYLYSYTVWWVVLGGLLIEGVAYHFAWHRPLAETVGLTIGLNIYSALAGALFVAGSLLVVYTESSSFIGAFLFSSPFLILLITIAFEYFSGCRFFGLERSAKTRWVILGANIPSVGLSIYAGMELMENALSGST